MNSGTIILGFLNGLIISLLAVGFVLVYKANRFLNFRGCVVVGIVTGLAVERFIIRPVRRRTTSPVRLLILTIGVSQVLLALRDIPGLTPTSQAPFPSRSPRTSKWVVSC